METVMFSSQQCQPTVTLSTSSRIRHYKIASQLKKPLLQKAPSKCFRIPEGDSTQDSDPNIFQREDIQQIPETFVETAKEYQMVGYKFVKTNNQKKDKRKLNRKNTSSASSRHSKYSSSLPSLDRGVLSKEILLERVKKWEEKENQGTAETGRLVQAKALLQTFTKCWQKQMKKDGQLLHRKPDDSLLNLSDAFRSKIQVLQQRRANQIRNNPKPDLWEMTLCSGRSFQTTRPRVLQKTSNKNVAALARKLNTSVGGYRASVPYFQAVGRSKLREEAQWVMRSPHRHFVERVRQG